MNAAIRHLVRKRAGDRCEYCRLPQTAIPHRLHVEHVIAQQHEPTNVDDITNLALACDRCNFHKGPNLSSLILNQDYWCDSSILERIRGTNTSWLTMLRS